MDGPEMEDKEEVPAHLKGIVHRSIEFIFDKVNHASQNKKYLVRVSYL